MQKPRKTDVVNHMGRMIFSGINMREKKKILWFHSFSHYYVLAKIYEQHEKKKCMHVYLR